MNKQGFFAMGIVLIAIFAIFMFSIIGMAATELQIGNLKNENCERLGFIEYKPAGLGSGVGFCKDFRGNLHYVGYEATGFVFDVKVTMQEITIGDVRTVAG